MGLSFDQVHLLLRKSVSRSLSSRTGSEFYKHLSIDEKCVGRGHKYVSILSDATTGKVIDLQHFSNHILIFAFSEPILQYPF